MDQHEEFVRDVFDHRFHQLEARRRPPVHLGRPSGVGQIEGPLRRRGASRVDSGTVGVATSAWEGCPGSPRTCGGWNVDAIPSSHGWTEVVHPPDRLRVSGVGFDGWGRPICSVRSPQPFPGRGGGGLSLETPTTPQVPCRSVPVLGSTGRLALEVTGSPSRPEFGVAVSTSPLYQPSVEDWEPLPSGVRGRSECLPSLSGVSRGPVATSASRRPTRSTRARPARPTSRTSPSPLDVALFRPPRGPCRGRGVRGPCPPVGRSGRSQSARRACGGRCKDVWWQKCRRSRTPRSPTGFVLKTKALLQQPSVGRWASAGQGQ